MVPMLLLLLLLVVRLRRRWWGEHTPTKLLVERVLKVMKVAVRAKPAASTATAATTTTTTTTTTIATTAAVLVCDSGRELKVLAAASLVVVRRGDARVEGWAERHAESETAAASLRGTLGRRCRHGAAPTAATAISLQRLSSLLDVVDEVAAQTVWAEATGVIGATELRLVLGVPGQAAQVLLAMRKLALVAVLAKPVLLEGPAQLRLVSHGAHATTATIPANASSGRGEPSLAFFQRLGLAVELRVDPNHLGCSGCSSHCCCCCRNGSRQTLVAADDGSVLASGRVRARARRVIDLSFGDPSVCVGNCTLQMEQRKKMDSKYTVALSSYWKSTCEFYTQYACCSLREKSFMGISHTHTQPLEKYNGQS